ncbi:mechanosensitive ion channel family protein [Methanoculleus horonobensis]|jgi:small-conductance mechanosensitive channel|uniref:mechanosensitive ion channel family protein n=1 Tax=Methanoculleus horonobensis TaxID=528314 RepID=UPI0008351008|nr:mechanosensitive ion channel domain-containing protein [Methanoculleus horonobensis]MDD3069815.1 mechanosensitive ion channel [Methanoculleus horonobensis]MDD4252200.1 mechanosensitive ion channel [Methanoculleus horonobensis]
MQADRRHTEKQEEKRATLRTVAVIVISGTATALFLLAALLYPDIFLERIFYSSLTISLVYFFFLVVESLTIRRIKDERERYSFRRTVAILKILVVGVILLRVWIDTNYILVAYGIIGAGIAVALQDLFRNFVGGILIIFSNPYRIGDRIEISETIGDVIDIGILTTRMLEIHARDVKGDQATGRIVIIPNGHILSSRVFNYTVDLTFVWDEISIPITYGSDWRRAISLVLDIVREETAATAWRAEREIERVGKRYYLPKRDVEPSVYLTLTDNWITFDIRYVTDVRRKRVTKDDLSRKLLAAIEAADGIAIATENIIVYDGGPFEDA